eukprot:6176349-Pleurochrysis_carterae.AAC.1
MDFSERVQVARVTGSLNVAPTSSARSNAAGPRRNDVPPRLTPAEVAHFNVTHHIRRFSFGSDFPGQHNPLDGVWTHSPTGAAVARYFLKVVPTTYEFLGGRTVRTDQFSVTQYFKPLDSSMRMSPSISFTFEVTPLRVRKTERRGGSLFAFLTRAAATVGGFFAVAGMIDSFWYHSSKRLVKMQLNKQG